MICRAGRETRFARSSCGWHFSYESPHPVPDQRRGPPISIAGPAGKVRVHLAGLSPASPLFHVHQPR